MVALCLEHKLTHDEKDVDGMTAADWARECGHDEVAELLSRDSKA